MGIQAKNPLIKCRVALFWLIFAGSCLTSSANQPSFQPKAAQTKDTPAGDQVEGAASEPEAVAVAEPNIGALLGIGTLGAHQGLLAGFNGGRTPPGAGLNIPTAGLQGIPDIRSLCNNGNSDALTNLLVYQYLSGGLPNGGAPGLPKVPTAVPGAAANPHLQALFEDSGYQTSTTVTTGLTTRTVTLEPTTHLSTSTSVYVTTITSVASSIIPVVFRGTTITTTITDRKTEVLTATEFLTNSKVTNPSVVQTLPLEITLVHKSTLGLNGRYTLDHVAPGATRVIEKPISTTSFDVKKSNIDLSSIDFSSVDLKGLNGGDQDMLNALSALLEQYSDGPRDSKRNDRYQLRREKPKSRFQEDRFEEEDPKISVIKGFTLRDREQSPKKKESTSSGTAALNTRYAKFLKKGKLKNNSLQPRESDRESEPFSASTSRRTVSSQRRRDVPHHGFKRSRFQQQQPTGRSVSSSRSSSSSVIRDRERAVRRNRHIQHRSGRSEGRTFNIRAAQRRSMPNVIPEREIKTTTAVITLRIHGTEVGKPRIVYRTITLGTRVGSDALRARRHISEFKPEPVQKMTQTESFKPAAEPELKPEDVVKLLKTVDKKNVQMMLDSLKNWVEFYMREVLDNDVQGTSVFDPDHKDLESNVIDLELPELSSSRARDVVEIQEAPVSTTALPSIPIALSKSPSLQSSSSSLCLDSQKTTTTTVYKTIYLSQP